MRIIRWEKPSHRLSRTGFDTFFGAPLRVPTVFRFKTHEFEVPSHGGAFSLKTVLAGEEVYCIGDRTVRLTPGKLLLINAGEIYSSFVRSETESVSVFVTQEERDSAIDSVLSREDDLLENRGSAFRCSEIPQIALTPDSASNGILDRFLEALDDGEPEAALDCTRLVLASAIRNVFGFAPRSA